MNAIKSVLNAKTIERFEAKSRELRFTLVRRFMIFITTLGILCSAMIVPVGAEDADCFGLNPLANCGGPSWYNEARRCYPKVTFLQPKIDSVWTTILNPLVDTAFQVHVRFCVGVGAQGFNTTGGSNGLVVTVFAEDPTGYIEDFTGCSETGISTDFECVECSHDCSFVTMSLNVGRTSGLINFWARASQKGEEGFDICACSTKTIPVYVTDQSVPDTIPLPLPFPEEFGPMACESQVGDPINVTNGNLYLERLDIAVQSDLGPSMDFIRYYNSYDTVYTSMFRNWRHSFEYSLDSTDTQTYELIECTGRRVRFTKQTLDGGSSSVTTYTPSFGLNYRITVSSIPPKYTIFRDDDVKLIFQELGSLDYFEDRAGNRTDLYCTSQSLDSVKSASGRVLRFDYGLLGRLAGLLDKNGNSLVVFNYAAGGGGVPGTGVLEKVRYQDSLETFEQYGYGTGGDQFRIVQISSSNAPTRTYQYDSNGRAIRYSRDDGSQQVDLSWSVNESTCSDTIKCTTTSPNGTAQRNAFWSPDYSKRMVVYTENSDCGECATTYSYDGGGMKQTIVYPELDGRVDSMYYDLRGNLVRQVRAATSSLKQATTLDYHSTYNLPASETYPSVANTGRTAGRYWNYDVNGNLTSIIESGWLNASDSVALLISFTNNGFGQVLKIDGPRTDVPDTIGFQYNPVTHELQTKTLANGDIYTIGARDLLGRTTITVGPNGDTTRFTYDVRGRIIVVTRFFGTADSASTIIRYTVDGDITSSTNPLGHITTFHRDDAGNIDKITDPLGNYVQNTFDLSGNIRLSSVFANGQILRAFSRMGYDTKNRLVADTSAYGSIEQYGYSSAGMLSSYINGRLYETKYKYDTLHRLMSATAMNGTDSAHTRFQYNSHNDLIKVTDPDGWVTSSYYDDFGRKRIDSSGATTIDTFKYDPASNLTSWKNQSDGITFTYDALNRLTKKRVNSLDSVTYQFDGTEYAYGKGRLYKAVNRTCTTKYRYDYAGRLFKEYRQLAGSGQWDSTIYTYDKIDNIQTITYPTGRKLKYTRDASSQITKVEIDIGSGWTTVAENVSYAPFGPATSWSLANGITVRVAIDSAYRIRAISTAPDTLARFAYFFDAADNVTMALDSVGGFDTLRYTYDGLDRVKSSTSRRFGDTLQQYTYTPNGNRIKIKQYHPAIDSFMLSYSANRLSGVFGADVYNYQSDRFGNIIRQVHGTQPPRRLVERGQ
jgi:YD repeat-containing protein